MKKNNYIKYLVFAYFMSYLVVLFLSFNNAVENKHLQIGMVYITIVILLYFLLQRNSTIEDTSAYNLILLYFIVFLILFSLLVPLFAYLSYPTMRIDIIVYTVLITAYVIINITLNYLFTRNDIITKSNDKHRDSILEITESLEDLKDKISNSELKNEVNYLINAFNYSDPISIIEVEMVESKIFKKINLLQDLEPNKISVELLNISKLLEKRNRIIKKYK